MVHQSILDTFAGLGKRLNGQPRLPTLRNFALGLVALLMVMVGMAQVRAAVWLDAALLVGGGLALWLWRFHAPVQRLLIEAMRLTLHRPWLAATLFVAAVGITIWQWFTITIQSPTVADWLWYIASVVLLLMAAVVTEQWTRARRVHWRMGHMGCTLVGIVAVAVVVRLIFLNSLPFGTWYDEAANGLEALRVALEPAYQPIYTDGVNSTGHYLWLIVGAFKLFGENTFAVRSISAVMGIATVIAAYFAGRELHSPVLGLVFAALFAVARWSITFSRLGMYNSATPLFELLALVWLLRGMRRGSALDFALAGVAVGLGLCFYTAFQLFLGVLGFFVLLLVWHERARWRMLVSGLAISAAAVLVVCAPVIHYALERPESYFARVQTTSLFADKTPEQRLPALWENTRKHLLMFHVRGDPNGRHNLPGEPMLDWVTGGLLVVGLAICLRYIHKPQYAIVPVWILVGLLGGILSLDFEAPQSLRAIGALPAVLLCAALPASELVHEWQRGAGRYFPQMGWWSVALLLLMPAAALNLHTYFVRQAQDFASWNAHSTPETIAAEILRTSNPAVEKYVISLFDGHPTIRFLARNVAYRRVETNTTLPILREMPNGMMLILDAERRPLYDEVRQLYPGAEFEEIRSPYGGPAVVYVSRLSPEQVQSIQGLNATYSAEGQPTLVRKEFVVDTEWPANAPLPLPFTADWRGVLAATTYGPHQFFVQAPGEVTLTIGESTIIEGDASGVEGLGAGVLLARGNHTIHLHAEGGEGRVRLAWQPPDGPPMTVPSWALYVPPVRSNGLLGRYFANGDWSGEPAFAQIDPRLSIYFHVPTLARPYTVEWSGKIAIPESGHYDFALKSIDESALTIDGVELARSQVRNEMSVGGMTLEAGLHDIVVRYADRTDHTYINLMWRPPGNDLSFRPIPTELLFPPQANYDQVDVGDLARFVQSDVALPSVVERATTDPATVDVVVSGLAQPRGIALHGETIYVAEAGKQRVAAFDATTGEELPSPFDGLNLIEPFDLAVRADGSIVVVDAGSGRVHVYDPATGDVNPVPLSPEYIERSRGVAVGPDGEIWLANTPGQRVVAVGLTGEVLQEIGLPPVATGNNELQPVDVAVLPDNSIFVTDVAGHFLYRFSLAGYLVSSQPIPVANALDSSHLATDAAGTLYMTEPEDGRVVQFDSMGSIQRIWSVRNVEIPDAKPVGIAVAEDGRIWVADSRGGRILQLTPGGD